MGLSLAQDSIRGRTKSQENGTNQGFNLLSGVSYRHLCHFRVCRGGQSTVPSECVMIRVPLSPDTAWNVWLALPRSKYVWDNYAPCKET